MNSLQHTEELPGLARRRVLRNGRYEYFGVFKAGINDYLVRRVRAKSYSHLITQPAWCLNSKFETTTDALVAIRKWGE